MHNREIHIGHKYLEAVFQRTIIPMNPLFTIDWQDQPSPFQVYANVERIPLESELPHWQTSLSDALTGSALCPPANGCLTFQKLSWLLQFATGVLNRRFAPHWGGPPAGTRYVATGYGRGTPSGGGRYPTEIYLCNGPNSHLLPGLYHYDPAHHALERLQSGNMLRQIQIAAFEHPAVVASNQILLISLHFWKNAFKYGDLAYYLGTLDVGALIASLRILAHALHIDLSCLLWFRDEALNRLLGQDTLQESVFALMPLRTAPLVLGTSEGAATRLKQRETFSSELRAARSRQSFQRSKRVLRFPRIETIHQATLIEDEALPHVQEICEGQNVKREETGPCIALPPPMQERLQADVFALFQQRRSSFGRFTRNQALTSAELATLLYQSSRDSLYVSDIHQQGIGKLRCTELMVIINHVDGLEQGAYAYDARQHCLWVRRMGNLTSFLQQHHSRLQNYNLAEAGAIITIVGKPGKVLDMYGNRGCRIMNIEAGQTAQIVSLTATALSLGCGIVAGFDNVAIDQSFDAQETDYKSLLLLLVGHEHPTRAELDYRLV